MKPSNRKDCKKRQRKNVSSKKPRKNVYRKKLRPKEKPKRKRQNRSRLDYRRLLKKNRD